MSSIQASRSERHEAFISKDDPVTRCHCHTSVLLDRDESIVLRLLCRRMTAQRSGLSFACLYCSVPYTVGVITVRDSTY